MEYFEDDMTALLAGAYFVVIFVVAYRARRRHIERIADRVRYDPARYS